MLRPTLAHSAVLLSAQPPFAPTPLRSPAPVTTSVVATHRASPFANTTARITLLPNDGRRSLAHRTSSVDAGLCVSSWSARAHLLLDSRLAGTAEQTTATHRPLARPTQPQRHTTSLSSQVAPRQLVGRTAAPSLGPATDGHREEPASRPSPPRTTRRRSPAGRPCSLSSPDGQISETTSTLGAAAHRPTPWASQPGARRQPGQCSGRTDRPKLDTRPVARRWTADDAQPYSEQPRRLFDALCSSACRAVTGLPWSYDCSSQRPQASSVAARLKWPRLSPTQAGAGRSNLLEVR